MCTNVYSGYAGGVEAQSVLALTYDQEKESAEKAYSVEMQKTMPLKKKQKTS